MIRTAPGCLFIGIGIVTVVGDYDVIWTGGFLAGGYLILSVLIERQSGVKTAAAFQRLEQMLPLIGVSSTASVLSNWQTRCMIRSK